MEKVSNHIWREWLAEGQIVGYKVEAIDAQGLRDWAKAIVTTLSAWKSNQYLALHDLSTGVSIPLLVLTHFNILDPGLAANEQAKIDKMMLDNKKLTIRLAVVLPLTTSGRLARVRARSSAASDRIESTVFYNREVALNWLNGFTLKASK
jgi:hypothetical protein